MLRNQDLSIPLRLFALASLLDQKKLSYLENHRVWILYFELITCVGYTRFQALDICGITGNMMLKFYGQTVSTQEWTKILCSYRGVSINDLEIPNLELVGIH